MTARDRQMIENTAQEILASGLRVFLAENGTYGFFTNSEGSSVVSFEAGLAGVKFSGNYKTSEPRKTGTGWSIGENRADYAAMLEERAPSWATRGIEWRHTTLKEHLATYGKSSRYRELAAK